MSAPEPYSPDDVEPRKGSPSPRLSEDEFKRRFLNQFQDSAYEGLSPELAKVAAAAWDAYANSRKSPKIGKAGPGYAHPEYDLSLDWIAARQAVQAAQRRHEDTDGPLRFLLINGFSRSEHTCPGELSKSYRMVEAARRELVEQTGVSVDVFDLSRLASEYGRKIHPCKACFSTSAALCHWPCSCYPNYSLGQVHDWNDIYPLWVEAHGIMIVTPVNWYQS